MRAKDVAAEVMDTPEPAPEADDAAGHADTPAPDPKPEDTAAEPKQEGGEETEAKGQETEQTQSPEQVVEVARPVLDAFDAAGIKHDYASDEDAVRAFGDLRSKIGERSELAEIGKQALPVWDQVQQEIRKAAEPKDEAPPPWDPPEATEADYAELQKPEEQRNPQAVQRVNARNAYEADKWNGWFRNPQSLVGEMIVPAMKEYVDGYMERREVQSKLEGVLKDNEDFAKQHEQELIQLVRPPEAGGDGVPLPYAIELLRLRGNTTTVEKKQTADEARKADVKRLAGAKTQPTGPAAVIKTEGRAPATNARAIAREMMEEEGGLEEALL